MKKIVYISLLSAFALTSVMAESESGNNGNAFDMRVFGEDYEGFVPDDIEIVGDTYKDVRLIIGGSNPYPLKTDVVYISGDSTIVKDEEGNDKTVQKEDSMFTFSNLPLSDKPAVIKQRWLGKKGVDKSIEMMYAAGVGKNQIEATRNAISNMSEVCYGEMYNRFNVLITELISRADISNYLRFFVSNTTEILNYLISKGTMIDEAVDADGNIWVLFGINFYYFEGSFAEFLGRFERNFGIKETTELYKAVHGVLDSFIGNIKTYRENISVEMQNFEPEKYVSTKYDKDKPASVLIQNYFDSRTTKNSTIKVTAPPKIMLESEKKDVPKTSKSSSKGGKSSGKKKK